MIHGAVRRGGACTGCVVFNSRRKRIYEFHKRKVTAADSDLSSKTVCLWQDCVHRGAYGVQDSLRSGFTSIKNELLPSHPLELSEKNFQLNQDKMNFSTLRNIQGLHAPLKLQMEYRAARQIQRLPFLPSSNLALDTLRGSDESIGFEDILCDPSQSEVIGEPHTMVEYKLGLL